MSAADRRGSPDTSIDPEHVFEFLTVDIDCHPQSWKVQGTVPDTLPYLRGHFPGAPVLPAVAFLDASCELLRRTQGRACVELTTLEHARFLKPVVPGQRLEIAFHRGAAANQWLFEWWTLDGEGARSRALAASISLSVEARSRAP